MGEDSPAELPEMADIDEFHREDPYITPYTDEVRRRYKLFHVQLGRLVQSEGSMDDFTKGFQYYGVQRQPNNGLLFREWIPGAQALYLTGEFNGWDSQSHPYTRKEYGKWELYLPPKRDKSPAVAHETKLKDPHGTKANMQRQREKMQTICA